MDTNITGSQVNPTIKPKRRGYFTRENASIIGKKGGRPKGIREIKPYIRKVLTAEKAQQIAQNIVDEAAQGNDKKQEKLLKMSGDLNDNAPQVNLQQNTFTLPPELILAARQMAEKAIADEIVSQPLIEEKKEEKKEEIVPSSIQQAINFLKKENK